MTFENQTTGGDTVVVDCVRVPEGGYVTIHDASLADGEALGSVAGTSAYLTPGTHENATVTLDEPVAGTTTLIPMAHRDTDGDERYTFLESEGVQDGPHLGSDGAVVASAQLTFDTGGCKFLKIFATPGWRITSVCYSHQYEDGPVSETEMTEAMTESDTATESTGGSGPGFTGAIALVALTVAALLAVRRQR